MASLWYFIDYYSSREKENKLSKNNAAEEVYKRVKVLHLPHKK
jgi:hypothetical protein